METNIKTVLEFSEWYDCCDVCGKAVGEDNLECGEDYKARCEDCNLLHTCDTMPS